jgi:hypothetical protein
VPDGSHDDSGRARMTVAEAARTLGISVNAVRQRLKRGTLESERTPDGRVFVYLDDAATQEANRNRVKERLAELEASQKAMAAPDGREAVPPSSDPDERGQEPPRARKVPDAYKNDAMWAQVFITAAASIVAVAVLVISVSEGRVLVAGLAGGLVFLSMVAFLLHLWLFRLGRDGNAENEDAP